jgi:hypothetical protein
MPNRIKTAAALPFPTDLFRQSNYLKRGTNEVWNFPSTNAPHRY